MDPHAQQRLRSNAKAEAKARKGKGKGQSKKGKGKEQSKKGKGEGQSKKGKAEGQSKKVKGKVQSKKANDGSTAGKGRANSQKPRLPDPAHDETQEGVASSSKKSPRKPAVSSPSVKKFGCPTCRYAARGCHICKRPGYKPRPRRQHATA